MYMQTIRETAVKENKFCFNIREVFFFKESLVQPKEIGTKAKQTQECRGASLSAWIEV